MDTHKERWTPLTRIFLADKPSVKIVRVDGGSVLEDGISSLSLSCISESNPPAQVEMGWDRFFSTITIFLKVMWSRKGAGVDTTPQYTEVGHFISSLSLSHPRRTHQNYFYQS